MEKNKEEGKQKELDREESQDKQIQETGQVVLDRHAGYRHERSLFAKRFGKAWN